MPDDIKQLKRALKSLKLRHVIIVILIGTGLWYLSRIEQLNINNTDRNDYKAVAETFISGNAVIAQKLGRVKSASHKGVGGGAGKVSYNVYSVRGEERTGVCYLTLRRNTEDEWYVTDATLMVEGAEYSIPIRRTGQSP